MTSTIVTLNSAEVIADYLDLTVAPADRGELQVRFILCDDALEPQLHCVVTAHDDDPLPTVREVAERTVATFAASLDQIMPAGAMLVAVIRPGQPTITEPERLWFRAAHRVCAEQRVRLLGVHLVTTRTVREIVLDDVT